MNVTSDMMPQNFWCTVSLTRQCDNTLMFPNLAAFMQTLLSLPHSSASVERIFSAVNRIKQKQETNCQQKPSQACYIQNNF